MASLTLPARSTLVFARPLERSREPACRPSAAASPSFTARPAAATSAFRPASVPASADGASSRFAAGVGLCLPDSPHLRHHSPCTSSPSSKPSSSSARRRRLLLRQPWPTQSSLQSPAGPSSPGAEPEPRQSLNSNGRNRTRPWLAPGDTAGPAVASIRAVLVTSPCGAVDGLPLPEAHLQVAGISPLVPAGSVQAGGQGEGGYLDSHQRDGWSLEGSSGRIQEELPQQGTQGSFGRHLERMQVSMLAVLRSIDVLRPAREGLSWSVPWKGDTIFQVMFLWFMAFWFIGSWLIPVLSQLAGLNHAAMSLRAHALYSLSTDVAEMAVGMFVLHSCLSRFRPLSAEWFRFKPRGTWYLDAVLACALFPIVQLLSHLNSSLLPVSLKLAAAPAMRIENAVSVHDPVATVIYAATVAVCAPVWEEVVFRGFLLPSLTRYLPLWGSIAASAAIFSLAHFSPQRLLPLFFLGVVLGVVFARSQNLLAAILSHSLWNCFVFLDLLM